MIKHKYALVGSHGTGKSSAAAHLGAIIKQSNPAWSVKIIEENVREISRIVNNRLNTPEFQKLCMIDHVHKELIAEQLYDIVVCDRTAIDTLVYGMVYQIALPPEYFSLAINHLNTFDCVFFVRPDTHKQVITDDGFRDINVEMRAQVDQEFERMLKLWGGMVKEIKTHEIFTFDYVDYLLGPSKEDR